MTRRAIVFDLDDTLYPHERFVHSGFATVACYVATVWGIPVDAALATLHRARQGAARGTELQALCRAHGLPARSVSELIAMHRHHAPSLSLDAAARMTLVRLRQDGWGLGILTNGQPSVQAAKVAALGLGGLIDHVVYAHEHAPDGKPAVACFAEVLRVLAVDAADAVFVGDDPVRDIGGARRAGLRTIRTIEHAARAIRSDADAIVTRIADVPAVAAFLLERESVHVA
jgi:putative hydrolase of the HAD superfamily